GARVTINEIALHHPVPAVVAERSHSAKNDEVRKQGVAPHFLKREGAIHLLRRIQDRATIPSFKKPNAGAHPRAGGDGRAMTSVVEECPANERRSRPRPSPSLNEPRISWLTGCPRALRDRRQPTIRCRIGSG